MKAHRNALDPRAVLLPSILTAGIFLATITALLYSCGGPREKVQVARSLEEAKKLAAAKKTWIVAEFWRRG
jgi:hypothetical protein